MCAKKQSNEAVLKSAKAVLSDQEILDNLEKVREKRRLQSKKYYEKHKEKLRPIHLEYMNKVNKEKREAKANVEMSITLLKDELEQLKSEMAKLRTNI